MSDVMGNDYILGSIDGFSDGCLMEERPDINVAE